MRIINVLALILLSIINTGCEKKVQDKQEKDSAEIVLRLEEDVNNSNKIQFVNGAFIQKVDGEYKCNVESKAICDILSEDEQVFWAMLESYYPKEDGKIVAALFSAAMKGNCCAWKIYSLVYYYENGIIITQVDLDQEELDYIQLRVENKRISSINAFSKSGRVIKVVLGKRLNET
jgi:hypothetical protein